MAGGVSQRPDGERTEKITINIGLVDLGEIDLLVQEGFYANRTDFIRSAIRAQLATRAQAVSQSVSRKTLQLGVRHITRSELEGLRERAETTELRVLGLATIADDVTPELARDTISYVEVLGSLKTSAAVRQALRDRTA